MVTLKHPAFGERVTVDVEPDCVEGWTAQGWIDTRPRPKPKPPKASPKTPSIGDD